MTVPAYAAAKGARHPVTKALPERADHRHQYQLHRPGYIDTNIDTTLMADPTRSRRIIDRIPAGHWGEPGYGRRGRLSRLRRVPNYVNGTTWFVDGGWIGH